MRISETIRRCVVFVGIRQDGREHWGGTAFSFSLDEGGLRFFYIGTAKHVADRTAGNCLIRLNGTDEKAVIFEAGELEWWNHPDEPDTVDFSVARFVLPQNMRVNLMTMRADMFATKRTIVEQNIGIGDEVYISGLFTRVTDTSSNQPVIRTGNIAMMPDEKIYYPNLGMIDTYLVEARSIGGLSGCPVFVRNTVKTTDAEGNLLSGLGKFYFLGSMIGHWQVPKDFDSVLSEAVNMGISAIVPAYKIMEVLDHPELAESRRMAVEDYQRNKSTEATLNGDFHDVP